MGFALESNGNPVSFKIGLWLDPLHEWYLLNIKTKSSFKNFVDLKI